MKRYPSLIDKDFENLCFGELKKYGAIQESRDFDTRIEGNKRKYIKLISKTTELDLVNMLKSITGYSFFMYEDDRFHIGWNHSSKRKKEIYYDPRELILKGFFISLFHEAGHYPVRDELGEIPQEKLARIKSIQIATTLKNEYNFCFLAGFQGYNEVYNYINKYLLSYYNYYS